MRRRWRRLAAEPAGAILVAFLGAVLAVSLSVFLAARLLVCLGARLAVAFATRRLRAGAGRSSLRAALAHRRLAGLRSARLLRRRRFRVRRWRGCRCLVLRLTGLGGWRCRCRGFFSWFCRRFGRLFYSWLLRRLGFGGRLRRRFRLGSRGGLNTRGRLGRLGFCRGLRWRLFCILLGLLSNGFRLRRRRDHFLGINIGQLAGTLGHVLVHLAIIFHHARHDVRSLLEVLTDFVAVLIVRLCRLLDCPAFAASQKVADYKTNQHASQNAASNDEAKRLQTKIFHKPTLYVREYDA